MSSRILTAGLPLPLRARLQGGMTQAQFESASHLDDMRRKLSEAECAILIVDEAVAGDTPFRLVEELCASFSGVLIFLARGTHIARELRQLARVVVLQHPLDPVELLKLLGERLGGAEESGPSEIPAETVALLDKLWDKNRDLVKARLDSVESLTKKHEEPPTDSEFEEARRSAHQLAGSLGTFGLQKGTLLAKEAEQLCTPGAFQADRLKRVVQVLRGLVNGRSTKTPTSESLLLVVSEDAQMIRELDVEATLLNWAVEACPDLGQVTRKLDNPLARAVMIDAQSASCLAFPHLLEDLLVDSVPIVMLAEANNDHPPPHVRWLCKPVTAYQGMMAVLRSQSALATEVPSCVLIVDDDPIVLKVVKTMLSKVDLYVETLEHPLEFWDTLDRVKPQLVILDIDLPPLGGIELCRAMRSDPRYAAVPVMFQSSYTDAPTIQRAFEAGADDFLHKPASGLELLTRVSNRLERTRQIAASPLSVQRQGPLHTSLDSLLARAGRDEIPVCLASILVRPQKGDAALTRVQRRLRLGLRSEDIVRQLGPAELLVGMLGLDAVRARVRLETILKGAVTSQDIGTAEFPGQAHDLDSLVELARGNRQG